MHRCNLESAELFLKTLNLQQDHCQLPSAGQIKGMSLDESDPAAVHLLIDNLPQMSVFHNLTHFTVVCGSCTSETCNLLSTHTDLIQHLECLDLSFNRIGRGGAVNLITSLNKFSTIKELNLWYTCLGFEDCEALSELLASSKYIEKLNIIGNKLSSNSIQLIVDGFFLQYFP